MRFRSTQIGRIGDQIEAAFCFFRVMAAGYYVQYNIAGPFALVLKFAALPLTGAEKFIT